MRKAIRFLSVALLVLPLGCREDIFVDGPVVPSLLLAPGPVEPGGEITLGIHFAVAPDWHLYWNGKNDSGSPMNYTVLEAPAGTRLGDAEWPAPVRLVSPGNIVDHVYFDETMLRVRAKLPDPLPAADTLVFKLALEWVVCHDVCEFGGDEVTLRVPVPGRSSGLPKGAARVFDRFDGRYPVALDASGASIAWEGTDLIVRDEDAAGIVFYPEETSTEFAKPRHENRGGETALVVPFETDGNPPRAAGVLVWEGADRPPARFESRPPGVN